MENSRIIVPHGGISVLATKFGVSLPTVRSALRGNSRTALSGRIRESALSCGGFQVREIRLQDIRTASRTKKIKSTK